MSASKIIKTPNNNLYNFHIDLDGNLVSQVSLDNGLTWSTISSYFLTGSPTNVQMDAVVIEDSGESFIKGHISYDDDLMKPFSLNYTNASPTLDISGSFDGEYKNPSLTTLNNNIYLAATKSDDEISILTIGGDGYPTGEYIIDIGNDITGAKIGAFSNGEFIVAFGEIIGSSYSAKIMYGALGSFSTPESLPTDSPISASLTYLQPALHVDEFDQAHIAYQYFINSSNSGNILLPNKLCVSNYAKVTEFGTTVFSQELFSNTLSESNIFLSYDIAEIGANDFYIAAQVVNDVVGDGNYTFVTRGKISSFTNKRIHSTYINSLQSLTTTCSIEVDDVNSVHISTMNDSPIDTDHSFYETGLVPTHGSFKDGEVFGIDPKEPTVVAPLAPCPILTGSPQVFTYVVPDDTIEVTRINHLSHKCDFAINPVNGNIYVVYSDSTGTGGSDYNSGGRVDVYDYTNEKLIATKKFGGHLGSIVCDPNGKVWIYQVNSRTFTTDAETSSSRLMILNADTLEIEMSLYSAYIDYDESAEADLAAMLHLGTSPKVQIQISGDYVYWPAVYTVTTVNRYSILAYAWNDLDNLPTADPLHEPDWEFTQTAPSWGMGTHYLPTFVLNKVNSTAFNTKVAETPTHTWVSYTDGIVDNATVLDMINYPWGYGSENTHVRGTHYRNLDTTNGVVHPSVTTLTDLGYVIPSATSILYVADLDEVWIGITTSPLGAVADGFSIIDSSTLTLKEDVDIVDLGVTNDWRMLGGQLDTCGRLWIGNHVVNPLTRTLVGEIYDTITSGVEYTFATASNSRFLTHPISGDVYLWGGRDELDENIRIFRTA